MYAYTYAYHNIYGYTHNFACICHVYQIMVVKIDEFRDDAGFIMMDRTDPFVSLTLGNQTFKTEVKNNAGGKNVEFNERLSFKKDRTSTTLKVCNFEKIYPHAQIHRHKQKRKQIHTQTRTQVCVCVCVCVCLYFVTGSSSQMKWIIRTTSLSRTDDILACIYIYIFVHVRVYICI